MLTERQLEELRQFDSPTVSNAIELFDVRPRTEGFMGPEIRCILPCEKPMVGYACTGRISAGKPPTSRQAEMWYDYLAHAAQTPSPTIVVIEDADPSPVGSLWGEVHASTAKSLGCVGTVTDGGVRDLDEVAAMGFAFFASCVLVSHAYVHFEEVGCPVTVGGLTLEPRCLLHADKHGVVVIPTEIASDLAEACRKLQEAERVLIDNCRARNYRGITLQDLKAWQEEMRARMTRQRGNTSAV